MSDHFISREEAEDDLLSCAAFLAERIKSADGRAEAMAAVVPLYLRRSDVDLAAELANTIDDPFSRDRLLTLVAEKCAELDDDEYAMQLADSVEEPGLRSEAIERLALKKAHKGQIDKAREFAAQVEHPEFVYAAIAVAEGNQGIDGWRQTLDAIEFPNARVQALLEISEAAVKAKDISGAAEHLEAAGESAATIEHDIERIRALIEIGNLAVEGDRKDLAIRFFDEAKSNAERLDNIHRDNLLAAVALGFLHSGSLDLAERALDLVTDKTQTATVLLGYAREYWRKEETDDAVDALDEAYQILRSQKEVETRSSQARFALMATIATQFAGFGKSERAIEIASTIEDDKQKIDALTQIAAILTQRREDEHARHALREIRDDADRSFALIAMSYQKARLGDREAETELLGEAQLLVFTVPQLSSRSSAYNEIAKRYAEAGEFEKANTSLNFALETVAAIRDESRRVTALCEAATLCDEYRNVFGDDEHRFVGLVINAST
jgi:tetratricopeptide (TPR) repeat protein